MKNENPTSIEIAPGLLCGDLDAEPALIFNCYHWAIATLVMCKLRSKM